jgi:quinol monooxygenase YgiN
MIAQIVVFKLKAPELREQFLEATSEMAAWLYQQPGFVSYELIEGEQSWSDRLVWQTREDEARGRNAFFNTGIAARILQCVDHDFRSATGEIIEFK